MIPTGKDGADNAGRGIVRNSLHLDSDIALAGNLDVPSLGWCCKSNGAARVSRASIDHGVELLINPSLLVAEWKMVAVCVLQPLEAVVGARILSDAGNDVFRHGCLAFVHTGREETPNY